MSLNDAQKETVRGWIADGLKVAEIQKRLVEEFDRRLTYMEVRFLVDDLGVLPKDPEPEPEPAQEKEAEDSAGAPPSRRSSSRMTRSRPCAT